MPLYKYYEEMAGVKPQNPTRFIPFVVSIIVLAILIFVALSCTVQTPARASEDFVNMDIIKQIESSGNPYAYNLISHAKGLYQITPICLQEYNDWLEGTGRTPIKEKELFDPQINEMVADWYINFWIPHALADYHKPYTIENTLIAYNAGIRAVVKGYCPKETRQYVKRYKQLARGK